MASFFTQGLFTRTGKQGGIDELREEVRRDEAVIADHTNKISTNTTAIAANASAISSLQDELATLRAELTTLKAGVVYKCNEIQE